MSVDILCSLFTRICKDTYLMSIEPLNIPPTQKGGSIRRDVFHYALMVSLKNVVCCTFKIKVVLFDPLYAANM